MNNIFNIYTYIKAYISEHTITATRTTFILCPFKIMENLSFPHKKFIIEQLLHICDKIIIVL